MGRKHEKMKVIQNTGKLIVIIILIITGFSCTRRKGEINRSGLIPADNLKNIIEDIYITKGLLYLPSVQSRFTPPDSVSAYDQVIEGHGYTRAAFDNTLRFYYIKKPKQLINIYDEVLARLSEMESRYSVEANQLKKKTTDIWQGKEALIFPGDSGSTAFSLNLRSPGVYVISFTLTLYPDDQSFDPSLYAYIVNPDSLLTGKRHYVTSLPYVKDGKAHEYRFTVRNSNISGATFTGNLFSNGSNPETSVSHFIMEDISVSNRAE
jgi:hypothetical protein